jgi:putative tricarboxylic transport membrane protein
MVAYVYLLPAVGFVASTAVVSAYLSWRLGAAPVAAAIAGIATAIGIYIVFHLILGLHLATGPWGF